MLYRYCNMLSNVLNKQLYRVVVPKIMFYSSAIRKRAQLSCMVLKITNRRQHDADRKQSVQNI